MSMLVLLQRHSQNPHSFLHHDRNQLGKRDLGMPAKLGPKLRGIGACVTVVDFTHQRLVDSDVFGPVEPDNPERGLAKFRNGMALAGADDEVGCGLVLDNEMHGLNKVTGESKITPNADIAKIELSPRENWSSPLVKFSRFSQAERGRSGGVCDLLRDEIKRTARAFVIEHNSARQMQPILLTIGTYNMVRIRLRYAV